MDVFNESLAKSADGNTDSLGQNAGIEALLDKLKPFWMVGVWTTWLTCCH